VAYIVNSSSSRLCECVSISERPLSPQLEQIHFAPDTWPVFQQNCTITIIVLVPGGASAYGCAIVVPRVQNELYVWGKVRELNELYNGYEREEQKYGCVTYKLINFN